MNLGDFIRYVLAPATGAVVLWELWTGKALSRYWDVIAVRAEQPFSYWANVIFHCVIIVLLLVLAGYAGL